MAPEPDPVGVDLPAEVEIAIIGCGPVGAVAGLLAARAGLDAVVIERRHEVYPQPRAIHFDGEIMRMLQALQLVDDVMPYVRVWHRSVFTGTDGDLLRVHEFPQEPVYGWAPHYLFEQPAFERCLRVALENSTTQLALQQTLTGMTPTQDRVTLDVRDEQTGTTSQVVARWVIAADGASSTARQLCGLQLDDKGFDEPWLVIDGRVEDDEGLPTESHMLCDPRRPSTVINGPRDLFRWEFMLLPDEDPGQLEGEESIWQLLAPWVDRNDMELVRAAVYRFHALVAPRWRQGRVVLVGDAAHQTPPFLGQGMCHGLRDVQSLMWRLRAQLLGVGGRTELDDWEDERRTHVGHVIDLAVQSGRDICILDADKAAARDARIRAEQRDPQAPSSPFDGLPPLTGDHLPSDSAAGHLFPQPTVMWNDHRALLDDLVGVDAWIAFRDHRWPVERVRVDRLDVYGQVCDSLEVTDEQRVVSRWMTRHACTAALVRPDRHVFASTDTVDGVDQLVRSWGGRFGDLPLGAGQ